MTRMRAVEYGAPHPITEERLSIGYLLEANGATLFVECYPSAEAVSSDELLHLIAAGERIRANTRFDDLPDGIGENFRLGEIAENAMTLGDAEALLRGRIEQRTGAPPLLRLPAAAPYAIAFFPWWVSDGIVEVGSFSLYPVTRVLDGMVALAGGAVLHFDAETYAAIDAILSLFHSLGGPVRRLTLVLCDRQVVLDGHNEEQLEAVAAFMRSVTFGALASRSFFDHNDYVSIVDLEGVIQRFSVPVRTLARTIRRRDGAPTYIAGLEQARSHISAYANYSENGRPIDIGLTRSLIRERQVEDAEAWARIDAAVGLFAQWNQDGSATSAHQEIVLAVATLLTLFDLRGPRIEDLLVPRIEQVFENVPQHVPRDVWERTRPGRNAGQQRLVSVWTSELVRARHQNAHGQVDARWLSRWSPWEHVLYACFLFPLLVKRELHRNGLYVQTRRDEALLETFEGRLALPADPPDAAGRRPSFSSSLSRWSSLDGWLRHALAENWLDNPVVAMQLDPGEEAPLRGIIRRILERE